MSFTKTIVKNLLSEPQYRRLSVIKNKPIWRPLQWLGVVMGAPLKVLPVHSRVTIKSGINVARKLDYARHDVYLNLESDFEYRVRLNSCKKEPETIDWLETQLKPGDVLYDVGANVGAYSLIAAKYHDGNVKVYSFEPAFLNYTQLCRNVLLNDCSGIVMPFHVALSDATGINNFNLRTLVSGSAVHAFGETLDVSGNEFSPVAVQPVLGFRLDDFIQQFELPAPNHIKIDVDGIEFQILRGMKETLEGSTVRSVMVEVNEGRGDAPDIIGYLTGNGFSLEWETGANHLFTRDR